MGSFEAYVFVDGRWSSHEASRGPFLAVSLHDSDIATVTYAPGPQHGGLAYLGFQPRDYFEDPTASDEVNLDEQAAGLSVWARDVLSAEVDPARVRSLLAESGIEEPMDDFVEDTVRRLITVLGLPLPDDLAAA
ncbi:hypothetical protein [Agromyces ramosus]|uniref:Immunity protein 51 of polymorphic toxin system n=1 Tax=Agromyces ramosus TaxID=33879 RepID=A0ABU0RB91_9MICO|nr:hypothetical protein [Agromyces ramosus]MDQ0894476.1 hypothetical protein [Agromyces ramosus]